MIEYVHRRLAAWGEWSVSRADGGGGISLSQYSYEEHTPGGMDALSAILANEPCLEMEMGVAWLHEQNIQAAKAVTDRYRDYPNATELELSVSAGCCERTWRNRRDKAHWLLLDWLNGRAIGEYEDEVRRAWREYMARMPKIVQSRLERTIA